MKSLNSVPPISLAVFISVISVFNVSSFAAKKGFALIKFFGSHISSPLSNANISTKKSSAIAIPSRIFIQYVSISWHGLFILSPLVVIIDTNVSGNAFVPLYNALNTLLVLCWWYSSILENIDLEPSSNPRIL